MTASIAVGYRCLSCKSTDKVLDFRHGDYMMAETYTLDHVGIRINGKVYCCKCGTELVREGTLPEAAANLIMTFVQGHHFRMFWLSPDFVWLRHRRFRSITAKIGWQPHMKQDKHEEALHREHLIRSLFTGPPVVAEPVIDKLFALGFTGTPRKAKFNQVVQFGAVINSPVEHCEDLPTRVEVEISWRLRKRN